MYAYAAGWQALLFSSRINFYQTPVTISPATQLLKSKCWIKDSKKGLESCKAEFQSCYEPTSPHGREFIWGKKKSCFQQFESNRFSVKIKWIYLHGSTRTVSSQTFNIVTPYCCNGVHPNLQKKLNLIKKVLVYFISIAMATSQSPLPSSRVAPHYIWSGGFAVLCIEKPQSSDFKPRSGA